MYLLFIDFQSPTAVNYDNRIQSIPGVSGNTGQGYLNIDGNVRLNRGYMNLNFVNGFSMPNAQIILVPFTANLLPTGWAAETQSGTSGGTNVLRNTSLYTRRLTLLGSFSINGGTTGFLLFYFINQSSTRIFTWTAPIAGGSAGVSVCFTFDVPSNGTIRFIGYQNSGATRLVRMDQYRRSKLFGQIL